MTAPVPPLGFIPLPDEFAARIASQADKQAISFSQDFAAYLCSLISNGAIPCVICSNSEARFFMYVTPAKTEPKPDGQGRALYGGGPALVAGCCIECARTRLNVDIAKLVPKGGRA